MPWMTQSEAGGFTQGEPWLPLGAENLARAVDRQDTDPDSVLNLTRHLLAIRAASPALREGNCEIVIADETQLALRRSAGTNRVCAVFNFGETEGRWPAAAPTTGRLLAAVNGATPGHLPAFGAILIEESA
jgi:alpha-glucosidase